MNTYRGVLNDGFPSVDDVLLQLVRQHSFDGLAVVTLSNLLHSVSERISLKKEVNVSEIKTFFQIPPFCLPG